MPRPTLLNCTRLEDRLAPSTVRTITYHQLTALPDNRLNFYEISNRISADGNKAVFTTSSGGSYQVYTINTDGTGQTLVDANGNYDVDISANGSVVLETIYLGGAGLDYRIVGGDGSNPHLALHIALANSAGARLSPDGSTIFFQTNTSPTGDPVNYPPGVYYVSAAGGDTPHLIASEAQISAVLGTTASVFSGNGNLRTTLGISADGNKVVFQAQLLTGDHDQVLLGVHRNGSNLHAIGPVGAEGYDSLPQAGLSADGTTVFRYDLIDSSTLPDTLTLTVYNFDGTGGHTVAVPGGRQPQTAGPELVQLTGDGSRLLLGSTGLVINTDGSGAFELGTDNAGWHLSSEFNSGQLILPRITMNTAGTRFVFATSIPNNYFQMVGAELNPASLGPAPSVGNVTVTPGSVATEGRSEIAVRANVAAAGTLQLVYPSFERDGRFVYADDWRVDPMQPLGGGVYVDTGIRTFTTVPGPRTVRVLALVVGADGKHHATAVEVDGLTVTSEVTPTLRISGSTSTVARSPLTLTITATNPDGSTNTSYSGTIHFSSTDQLAGLPANYTFVAGDQGVHSFPVTFRTVGSQTFTATDIANTSITGNTIITVSRGPRPPFNMGPAINTSTGSIGMGFAMGVADFDRDGKLDVAVPAGGTGGGVGGGALAVLLGEGNGHLHQANGSPITLGHRPFSAAVGDYDEDGIHDLAVVNGQDNTMSIILGNGNGTFTPVGPPVTGANPFVVATGDFNEDGNLDLAVANSASNTVGIFLGDGDGGFTLLGSALSATNSIFVAVADVNTDGHQDIVSANYSAGTVSIFLGKGNGTFQLAGSPYAVGGLPRSIAFGDFNGDGKRDFAVANSNGSTVTILTGDGSGGFTVSAPITVGTHPFSVGVADFDGDGLQDLAVAVQGDDKVAVLLGNGDGSFAAPLFFATGSLPTVLAVGDFNADGRTDLVTGNAGDNSVSVLLNQVILPTSSINALPATTASPSFQVSWTGSNVGGPGIAHYDIYVSDNGGAFVPWLTATTQTSATFTGANAHTYGFYSIATDTSGYTQLTPTAAQTTTTVVLPVSPPPPPPPPGTVGTRVMAVGAGTGSSPRVRTFNPDGSERGAFTVFDAAFTGGVRVVMADFNGDGELDLVVGTGPGASTLVRVLDGRDQHELFSFAPFEPAFRGGVFVAAGDLTGDGRPDLVVTPDEGGGPRARVFDGRDFTQVADFFGILGDPSYRGGARPAIGDVTGDGVADLFIAAGFGGGPRVAVFDGTKITADGRRPDQNEALWDSWKPFGDLAVFEPSLRNGVFIAAGDLTGDGFAELIAGGGPGGGPRIFALSGRDLMANRQVQVANFFGGNPNNRGGVRIAVKDLDGDRQGDLVVGSGPGGGGRVTTYAGKAIPADGPPTELLALDAFAGFDGGVFVG